MTLRTRAMCGAVALSLACGGRGELNPGTKASAESGERGQARPSGGGGWVRQLHGPGRSGFYSVAVDATGDVLAGGVEVEPMLAGDLIRAFVMKLSGAEGGSLWTLTDQPEAGRDSVIEGLDVNTASDVFVGGYTWQHATSSRTKRAFVRKLSGADGSLIWQRELRSTGDTGSQVHAVALAEDDSLVVGADFGLTSNGYMGEALAIALSGEDGAVLWRRRLRSSGYENVRDVAAAPGGGAYVSVLDYGGDYNSGAAAAYVVTRLSGANGSPLWESEVIGNVRSLASGRSGVFVGGSVRSTGAESRSDIYAEFLTGSQGASVWTASFGTPSNDLVWGAASLPGGNFVVAGKTYGALDGVEPRGETDAHITLISGADGSQLQTWQFGTAGNDDAIAVAVGPDQTLFACGTTDGILDGSDDSVPPDASANAPSSPFITHAFVAKIVP